jgi:hypothetical protein
LAYFGAKEATVNSLVGMQNAWARLMDFTGRKSSDKARNPGPIVCLGCAEPGGIELTWKSLAALRKEASGLDR